MLLITDSKRALTVDHKLNGSVNTGNTAFSTYSKEFIKANPDCYLEKEKRNGKDASPCKDRIMKIGYPLKCSCFPYSYSCVALYQRVVPFNKAMGLVLGSEIVIPEKVRMGRTPLPME